MIEKDALGSACGRGWFKSTYSGGASGCVEVRFDTDLVFVRDSKDRRAGQPVVGVPSGEWASFLDTIRH